jgi:hypothetical protein
VVAPITKLSLQLLALHRRAQREGLDGRDKPAVGDAKEAEPIGSQAAAVAGQGSLQ